MLFLTSSAPVVLTLMVSYFPLVLCFHLDATQDIPRCHFQTELKNEGVPLIYCQETSLTSERQGGKGKDFHPHPGWMTPWGAWALDKSSVVHQGWWGKRSRDLEPSCFSCSESNSFLVIMTWPRCRTPRSGTMGLSTIQALSLQAMGEVSALAALGCRIQHR